MPIINMVYKKKKWWKPWANTVLYCPLKDDTTDHSGNHTVTLNTTSYGTVAKDSTGFYYFNWWYLSTEAYSWPIAQATLSVWVNRGDKSYNNNVAWGISTHYKGSDPYHCWLAFQLWWKNNDTSWVFLARATSGTVDMWMTPPTRWTWVLLTLTYNNSEWAKLYRNWTLESSFSNTNSLRSESLPTFIWATNPFTDQFYEWYISEFILEDKAWTATEVSDYYNLTKANYADKIENYQQVEWIWSSWTQYIVTDIKLNNTHTIELKADRTWSNNNWDKFYGWWDANQYIFLQLETWESNKLKAVNYDGSHYAKTSSWVGTWMAHIYKHSNTAFYMDWNLVWNISATTFTMNTWMNIFAMWNSQSDGREPSIYNLYYFKVYDSSDNVVYELVPCYRKSDSVIWMYDIVNDQFYTNSWTWTFTKWPDVN